MKTYAFLKSINQQTGKYVMEVRPIISYRYFVENSQINKHPKLMIKFSQNKLIYDVR